MTETKMYRDYSFIVSNSKEVFCVYTLIYGFTTTY